jgi:hypothetical protein
MGCSAYVPQSFYTFCRFAVLSAFPLSIAYAAQQESSDATSPPPAFEESLVLPANSSRHLPLAPGMLVSIYGEHLGPQGSCKGERALNTSDFPTSLCETQVKLGDVDVGLLYVQDKQINFVVPPAMPEGTTELRVEYAGRAGSPVSVEVRMLSLDEPAYVHMPVWIHVELPYFGGARESIRYPFTMTPWQFGTRNSPSYEFEVRRDGKLLPKVITKDINGVVGFGSMAAPSKPKYNYRLPLHLQYRFDEPGTYEIRFTARRRLPAEEVIYQSGWTPIQVQPFSDAQRREWLQHQIAATPSDATELLTQFLPSILAYPDDQVLAVIMECLYHPDYRVQNYAMYSLEYYGDKTIASVIPDLVRRRGPTLPLAYEISWRRDLFQDGAQDLVDSILPFLKPPSSHQQLAGALKALQFLKLHYDWSRSPDMPEQMDRAVLAVAAQLVEYDDYQILGPLAEYLGTVKSDPSRELLWKLVERGGNAREQALICLGWIGDPRDQKRLEDFKKGAPRSAGR